jgi:hypothetical protein
MQFGSSNNIYRKSGFGLHQLRNCLRGKFCSPQAAPSRGAGMLRTGGTLQFDVTLPFWITESSCSQALMSPRWWWQMHGQSAPVQGQTGPSWQGGADVWILLPQ